MIRKALVGNIRVLALMADGLIGILKFTKRQ